MYEKRKEEKLLYKSKDNWNRKLLEFTWRAKLVKIINDNDFLKSD